MLERDLLFETSSSEYLWCTHCQRTYKNGEYREVIQGKEVYQMCPYEGCSGDAVINCWEWDKLVESSDMDLPQIPEKGVEYNI